MKADPGFKMTRSKGKASPFWEKTRKGLMVYHLGPGATHVFFIYLFQGAVKFLDLEACWISWHFLMFLSLVPTIGLSEHLQETLIIDGKTCKNDGFL